MKAATHLGGPAPVRVTKGTWQWYENADGSAYTPPAQPQPEAPQTAGERVLARIMALGDEPGRSEDYRAALGDVLAVLTDCAPECHQAGHR